MDLTKETINEIDDAKELENLKKVEAVLFISGRFLNLKELVTLTDINPILLKQLLDKLEEKYSIESSGLSIIKKDDMWKMDVRQEYSEMINKLATGSAEFTKAEQETLAIIAYKQPVKQSVIVKIRGNKSYEHIKNFIKLGLVKSKKSGHTLELNLSPDFYDYFQVSEPKGSDDIQNYNKNSDVSEPRGSDDAQKYRSISDIKKEK